MKKNCIFLVIDCLRADKCWGNERICKTPTINSLCEKGTTFTQAIATTTTTSPSFGSILTGFYPFAHGIKSLRGYKLNQKVETLAQILSANGYHTYAEVTGPLLPQIGLNRGFEHYHLRGANANMYSSWYEELLAKFKGQTFREPYFVFIHFFELHRPRAVAKPYNQREFGKSKYERALSSLDAYLGKLLEVIDFDNTIIIFHADHGEKIAQTPFQEYSFEMRIHAHKFWRRLGFSGRNNLYLLGHGFHVYDYLVRVPLVFVGKDIFPEGKVIPNQVRAVDIFPTICQALKSPFNSDIHGQSLFPLINGSNFSEIPAYCEACGTVLPDRTKWLAGIRTPKYKYVFAPYTNNTPDELYDLEKDPKELNNIATENAELAKELRQQIRKIREPSAEKENVRQKIKQLKDSGSL